MRALAVGLLLAATATAHADDCSKHVGDKIPEVTGTDDAGKSVSTKAKGWTFVTVGASWCDPCKKELPAWDGLVKDYLGKITPFAVDNSEKVDDGKAFHKEMKIKNMTSVYTKNVFDLGTVMPSTFIVDDKGIIRYERCGFEKGDVSGEVKKMKAALDKFRP